MALFCGSHHSYFSFLLGTVVHKLFLRLQLEELETKDEVVNVPPEEVVAEKQTLLFKLHSFEKKEPKEDASDAPEEPPTVKKSVIIEPPKPPPKKVEVRTEDNRHNDLVVTLIL